MPRRSASMWRPASSRQRPTPTTTSAHRGRAPVAVHDDVEEARAAAEAQFGFYGALPDYQRILAIGGARGPAGAALVGNESQVENHLQALFDAGATDVWASIFPVGEDRAGSRRRTRELLTALATH